MRIPLLHRFRFSLRTFFVSLFVLSLFGSNAYVSWKWHEARQEIERLREQLGYLKIGDPTKLYVREVPTTEPLSWRWRIYVPHLASFFMSSSRIPKSGTRTGKTTSIGHPTHARYPMPGEYTLEARVERNQKGAWRLAMRVQGIRVNHSIMPPDAGWLASGPYPEVIESTRQTEVQVAGSRQKTESFAADDTVVLLRLRAPTDEHAANHEPCDGVMIWFEKLRRPIAKTSASRTNAGRPVHDPPQPADR